ncbi:MAG TPA: VOC family protein [Acidimicrobiia bacterium]|nr:VOC family protein [Acidimicrobiia bacterium]
MKITRLHQVAQKAEDLDRATAFYRDVLGLRHIASFDPPGLAFFDLGGTRLLIERGAPSSLIYLAVPDIEAAVSDLRDQGVEITSEPHRIFDDADGTFGEPAEEWMAFFEDSEGNLVGLVERR